MSDVPEFSALQLDALRELMNIGFGQAAVALSEVIDLRVMLSVPRINVLRSSELVDFIDEEIRTLATYAVVEQPFFGNFQGESFFLLPAEEESKLRGILDLEQVLPGPEYCGNSIEDEALVEIGNIVIGACVGKMAALLKDQVSFQPPRVSGVLRDMDSFARRLGGASDLALVFKTLFHFEQANLAGFLFLVASEHSIGWIKKAVDQYLEELG